MPSKRIRWRYLALLPALVLLVSGAPLGVGSAERSAAAARSEQPVPWEGAVRRADCGPDDRVETGLQGQTTREERDSGASEEAYNCNLELVGQFQGEGAKWQMAWFNSCAYVGTNSNSLQQQLGTVVVDASDPSNPQASTYLDDNRTFLDPHESLKVNEERQLLAAAETGRNVGGIPGSTGEGFAVYDLSGDCSQPELLANVEFEFDGSVGHAGDFAPDGLTYYASGICNPGITVIDIDDPTQPQMLALTDDCTHDLSVSRDGTRVYLAQPGNRPHRPIPNGLVILDSSDFQERRPNPEFRTISETFWDDGATAQQTIPVTYGRRARGRPTHVIFTDEVGSGFAPAIGEGQRDACDRGLPPHGFARIMDVRNERNPRTVSKLMLEVNDPAFACDEETGTLNDWRPEVADREFYGYSTHYCGIDRPLNPTMLACTMMNAGLRVFDISNPYRPREIAYYKPPAQRDAFLPGSAIWNDYRTRDRRTDRAVTQVRFLEEGDETHLWFVSQDNGFQIVRFTNDVLDDDKDKDKKKKRKGKREYRDKYKDKFRDDKFRDKFRKRYRD